MKEELASQKKKPKDFETALARLEEITNRLESGDIKLEESIALYTEGVEIAAFCSRRLSDAEKKMTLVKEKNKDFMEVPFSEHDEDEGSGN